MDRRVIAPCQDRGRASGRLDPERLQIRDLGGELGATLRKDVGLRRLAVRAQALFHRATRGVGPQQTREDAGNRGEFPPAGGQHEATAGAHNAHHAGRPVLLFCFTCHCANPFALLDYCDQASGAGSVRVAGSIPIARKYSSGEPACKIVSNSGR